MKRFNYLILFVLIAFVITIGACSMEGETDVSSPSTGRGGSMASFSVVGNNLYIVDDTRLKIFDISEEEQPKLTSDVDYGRRLETTFVLGNHLYVGSQTGMLIYNISDPENPIWLSTYEHVTSCDPVVVTGNFAYVTLRTQSNCNWGENLLDIIDVSNKDNPQALNSISMTNPRGLAVDGDLLFVCDNGLKVFDITDRVNPALIEHVSGIDTYDVLAISGKLIITGSDQFLIYDYTDLLDIKLLYTLKNE